MFEIYFIFFVIVLIYGFVIYSLSSDINYLKAMVKIQGELNKEIVGFITSIVDNCKEIKKDAENKDTD